MTKRPSPKQEEKSKASREKFIQAAYLLLCENGYSGASLDDIIEKAERSKGAFYHHFESKEDLFRILFEEMIRMVEDSSSRVKAALNEGLSLRAAMLKSYEANEDRTESVSWLHSLVELYFVGLRDPWVKKLLQRLHESIVDTFADALVLAMKQGKIKKLKSPREFAEILHEGNRGVLFMEVILNDGKHLKSKIMRFIDHELGPITTRATRD